MLAAVASCRLVAAFALFIAIAAPAAAMDSLALQDRVISIIRDNSSAMVRVKAVYPSNSAKPDSIPQVVIGSGFFISREGLLITNASIVSNPLRVWVEHQQIAYAAEVVGLDDRSNVAFLRLLNLPTSFNFLHLADTLELPPIGTFLVRLSMPLEFEASPTTGIVSGFESRFGERFFPCNYIRTNIAAGPGDGGSAYLDLSGRLVGIQVGSLPDIQSSYILPSRAALRIRDDILFAGKVTYGWIGFEVQVNSSIQDGSQLVIREVLPASPARDAGLAEGDILHSIGDYRIHVVDDLRNAMFYSRVGQYVDVQVIRETQLRRFPVRIAPRPRDEPMEFYEAAAPATPIESPLRETVRPAAADNHTSP